ncbi:MAG: hypothetical protein ACYTG5_05945 [Planctomycetota bacterium]|jgi:hypothetical protein
MARKSKAGGRTSGRRSKEEAAPKKTKAAKAAKSTEEAEEPQAGPLESTVIFTTTFALVVAIAMVFMASDRYA